MKEGSCFSEGKRSARKGILRTARPQHEKPVERSSEQLLERYKEYIAVIFCSLLIVGALFGIILACCAQEKWRDMPLSLLCGLGAFGPFALLAWLARFFMLLHLDFLRNVADLKKKLCEKK